MDWMAVDATEKKKEQTLGIKNAFEKALMTGGRLPPLRDLNYGKEGKTLSGRKNSMSQIKTFDNEFGVTGLHEVEDVQKEKVVVKFDGGCYKKVFIIGSQHFDLTPYFVHLNNKNLIYWKPYVILSLPSL